MIRIMRPYAGKCMYKRYLSVINGRSKDANNSVNKAVSEAERIVGFPTSYLSLRALLSNELSAVALHIRKLARSQHPLITTARGILFDSKHNVQGRGLIVLLLSKTIASMHGMGHLKTNGSFEKQRNLAELTELIYTGFLVHRGIVDIGPLIGNSNHVTDMELGNKMAVLSGDFLLANACVALAELENSTVVGLMSRFIADMSQGYFLLPEAGKHSQITSLTDLPSTVEEWQNVMYLAHGSLLSNACRSAAILAKQSDELVQICAEFGKHTALAQQARLDINRITKNGCLNNGLNNCSSSELCALPVIIAALEHGGKEWMKEFVTKNDDKPQHLLILKEKLCTAVTKCSEALQTSEELCAFHREKALHALTNLPQGEARKSLEILTQAFST